MTDLRTAAQQALEALQNCANGEDDVLLTRDALAALRAALAEPVQECPNCASLQDQNTELDRKLAELEQTSLELCNACGWKTLIPGDCCLNCERKHPRKPEPNSDYERGFVDGMSEQARRSVDKAVNAMTKCKPLAEEEIARLVTNDMVKFARAIERAHGIT